MWALKESHGKWQNLIFLGCKYLCKLFQIWTPFTHKNLQSASPVLNDDCTTAMYLENKGSAWSPMLHIGRDWRGQFYYLEASLLTETSWNRPVSSINKSVSRFSKYSHRTPFSSCIFHNGPSIILCIAPAFCVQSPFWNAALSTKHRVLHLGCVLDAEKTETNKNLSWYKKVKYHSL